MGAASRRRGSRSRDELAAEDTEVCGGAGTASGAGKPSESSMWPRPRARVRAGGARSRYVRVEAAALLGLFAWGRKARTPAENSPLRRGVGHTTS